MTKPATIFGMAEEAAIASAGDNRACSDGRSRKNKCGSGERTRNWGRTKCRRFSKMRLLCYRYRSKSELLCVWRFWAHGPTLQK